MLSDKVIRVVLTYKGAKTSPRWYYNLSEREAIKRAKKVYNLTGKHNVTVTTY